MSVADRLRRHLGCSGLIAPVAAPASFSHLARIFLAVFPRQLSNEMRRRFFGSEYSVLLGLGMGTHWSASCIQGMLRISVGFQTGMVVVWGWPC